MAWPVAAASTPPWPPPEVAAAVATNPVWIRLKTVEQGAGSAVAPVDPSTFRLSGGLDTDTGIVTMPLDTGAVAADGYQEAVAYWSRLLDDEIPAGIDWTKNKLAFRILVRDTPPGTVELNLWAGLLDGVPSGTASGCCGFAGHNNASLWNIGQMNATTLSFSSAGDIILACIFEIKVLTTGSTVQTRITGYGVSDDGVSEDGGPNWGSGQDLVAASTAWRMCFGVGHRSVDSLAGITASFSVDYAIIPICEPLALAA